MSDLRRSQRVKGNKRHFPIEGYYNSKANTTNNNNNSKLNVKEALQQEINSLSPQTKAKINEIQKKWKYQKPLYSWFIQQGKNSRINVNTIVQGAYNSLHKVNKADIRSAILGVHRSNNAYTAPAVARSPNAAYRLQWALRNKALNENTRRWTNPLRQSRSGSLFEQVAIAVAAAAAGVKVLYWGDEDDFPNTHLKDVFLDRHAAALNGKGILVLKSSMSLEGIRKYERQSSLQNAWFEIYKLGSINNPGATGYSNVKNMTPIPSTNSSLKGYWDVEVDNMFFQMRKRPNRPTIDLHVVLIEDKIARGKAESVPAEAIQLAKGGRALEMLLGATPFKLRLYFYPLMYGVPRNAKVQFTDPFASRDSVLSNVFQTKLGNRYRTHLMNDALFTEETGINPEIIKSVLDVLRRKEMFVIYKQMKSYITKGVFSKGRNHAIINQMMKTISNNPLLPKRYKNQMTPLLANAQRTLNNARLTSNPNVNMKTARIREGLNANGIRAAQKAAQLLHDRGCTFSKGGMYETRALLKNLGVKSVNPYGGSSASTSFLVNRMKALANQCVRNNLSVAETAWAKYVGNVTVHAPNNPPTPQALVNKLRLSQSLPGNVAKLVNVMKAGQQPNATHAGGTLQAIYGSLRNNQKGRIMEIFLSKSLQNNVMRQIIGNANMQSLQNQRASSKRKK